MKGVNGSTGLTPISVEVRIFGATISILKRTGCSGVRRRPAKNAHTTWA